nr:uncharacterized protein LOC116428014 [Nomia melanderi]
MHERSRDQVAKLADQDDGLDYALEMCRWLLKPLGIWSLIYSHANRKEKALSILLLIAGFSSMVYIMVPLVCRLVLDDITGKIKMQLLGTATNCSLSVIKYLCLVLRRKTFARCMRHMENDWRIVKDRHHRAIMLKQATFSRSLVMLCIVFIYSSCISFHVMMPWSRRRVVGNVTLKPLVYPSYDRFFDVQASPVYELIYLAQCFAGFVRHTVTTATFSLVVVFVTHVCGQMQIQISRLEEFNCGIGKDTGYDPLGDIIRGHAEILRSSDRYLDSER